MTFPIVTAGLTAAVVATAAAAAAQPEWAAKTGASPYAVDLFTTSLDWNDAYWNDEARYLISPLARCRVATTVAIPVGMQLSSWLETGRETCNAPSRSLTMSSLRSISTRTINGMETISSPHRNHCRDPSIPIKGHTAR